MAPKWETSAARSLYKACVEPQRAYVALQKLDTLHPLCYFKCPPPRPLLIHRSPLRMGWGFHCLLESGSKFTLHCLGKVAAGLQPLG